MSSWTQSFFPVLLVNWVCGQFCYQSFEFPLFCIPFFPQRHVPYNTSVEKFSIVNENISVIVFHVKLYCYCPKPITNPSSKADNHPGWSVMAALNTFVQVVVQTFFGLKRVPFYLHQGWTRSWIVSAVGHWSSFENLLLNHLWIYNHFLVGLFMVVSFCIGRLSEIIIWIWVQGYPGFVSLALTLVHLRTPSTLESFRSANEAFDKVLTLTCH